MLDRRVLTALILVAGCGRSPAPSTAPAEPPRAAPAPPIAELVPVPLSIRATESAALAAARVGDRRVLFVADADDRAVVTVDAQSLAPRARVELGTPPRDLLVLESGVVLVTLPEANAIAVLESAGTNGELREARRIATSTEPLAMASSLDGRRVAVTAGAGHRVDFIAAEPLVTQYSVEVPREPRAAVFSEEGTLFVTHATSGSLTTVSADGARGAAIDLDIVKGSFDERGTDPPRRARQAHVLVRITGDAGEPLFAPLVENAPKNGAPPGGYGGTSSMFTPIPPPRDEAQRRAEERDRKRALNTGPLNRMSAFDLRVVDATKAQLADEEARPPGRVPALLHECLLPRAAVVTSASPPRIAVACAGESAVIELDAKPGHPRVVRRVATPRGPAALARIDDAHVFVWSPLARALTRVAFGSENAEPASTVELPRTKVVAADVLAGRELFARTGDPRISKDGLACASCHPDGRDDGLVWQTPLGDRRPRTLAGNVARDTSFGWGGEQPTIERHVTQTVRRLRGTGLPSEELQAIFAYLRSLPPVPVAARPDDPAALRGADLFGSEREACATCHDPANGFTDNRAHGMTSIGPVVTPSLTGVGARPRLFHDGRYASLDAMLDEQAGDYLPMGGIAELSPDERRDLAAYLRTL